MTSRWIVARVALLAGAAFCFSGADARADGPDAPITKADAQDAMHAYFLGEKQQGYFWGGIGLFALSAGGYAFARRTEFSRGFAYPMMAVGLIQLAVGVVLLVRSDAQIAALDKTFGDGARGFRDAELERIRRVNRTFLILEIAEAVLIAGGIGLAGVGASRGNDTMKGVGLGLALQATAMLALDGVASHRAHIYQSALERFDVAVTPLVGASGLGGAALTLGGRFD